MSRLGEQIAHFRSLPEPSAHGTAANIALRYQAKFGQLPSGWTMVFGVPRYLGTRLSEETRSRNVDPVALARDVSPIASPEGGTKKVRHVPFRANLTSGNRTQTHHEDPHQHCATYDPVCRDREWETPIWIGGTDWVKKPIYRHPPPDVRQVFAQDPTRQIPPDKPLPDAQEKHVYHFGVEESIARFRALCDLDEATSSVAVGPYMQAPVGLLRRSPPKLWGLRRRRQKKGGKDR